MPSFEVEFTSNGATVTPPYTYNFTIPLPNEDLHHQPLFFRSIAAYFNSSTNIPSALTLCTFLYNSVEHNQIRFPLPNVSSTSPSYHYFHDIHLGNLPAVKTVQGTLVFQGSQSIQLPTQMTLVFSADSQYM